MNFDEIINERYSVRTFSDKKVEEIALNKILNSGHIAPTAHNNQPQRIIVVDNEDLLNRISECDVNTFAAPLIFVVCYDCNLSWKREFDDYESGYTDAAIVTTHMMLKATELQLGSLWIANFNPRKISELFSLPNNIIPTALLAVGYKKEGSKPSKLHTICRDKYDIISYNKF